MSAPKYTIGQRVRINGTPGTGRITGIALVLGRYTYTLDYDDGKQRHAIEDRIVLAVPMREVRS